MQLNSPKGYSIPATTDRTQHKTQSKTMPSHCRFLRQARDSEFRFGQTKMELLSWNGVKDAESPALVISNIDRLNLKFRSVAADNRSKNWALHDVHRSLQRPALKYFNARSAKLSSRPAAISSSNWRSQTSASNSANHARKTVRSAEYSRLTACSISCPLLIGLTDSPKTIVVLNDIASCWTCLLAFEPSELAIP